MRKFINFNNTNIIDITDIQSVKFTKKEIGILFGNSPLAKRYTQLTGKEISNNGTNFEGTYDRISINLKNGDIIVVEDFNLKELKEYIISSLESVSYFECAKITYQEPSRSISIDGEIEVTARLETISDPLCLDLGNRTLDVKIEQ